MKGRETKGLEENQEIAENFTGAVARKEYEKWSIIFSAAWLWVRRTWKKNKRNNSKKANKKGDGRESKGIYSTQSRNLSKYTTQGQFRDSNEMFTKG